MSRFLSGRFQALEAYVPGEQPKDTTYIKLNTNESPFPPSPKVFERLDTEEIKKLNLYPDPDGTALRRKIAGMYGLEPENVILSNGSDEVLAFAFMAFCDGERPVAFPDISYGFYPVLADLYSLPRSVIPLREDFGIDCRDYFGINKNIVIANPNAPTGLTISLEGIETMLKTNPNHVVLIDEAYVDFGAESCVGLVKKYDNLLVVRTYSKSRFMAGVRLGFAMGSVSLIEDLNRIKYSINPYNINRLTLIAGEAAIDDDAYYVENCRETAAIRDETAERLRGLGFSMTESHANFLFARHPDVPGAVLYERLKAAGVLVRHFDKPRISEYLRITIGNREQMNALIAALAGILGKGEKSCAPAK